MLKDIGATIIGTLFTLASYSLAIFIKEKISPYESEAFIGIFLLVIAPACLSVGSFITGYISGKNSLQNQMKYRKIIFVSPGLYIALIGFVINIAIDGRLAPDSIVPLFSVGIIAILIGSFFTHKGFNYSR